MGLEDITHAIKGKALLTDTPVSSNKVIAIRALPETKQIQIEFPEGELTMEECGALLFQATRLVAEKIRAKQGIKPADAGILANLKRDRKTTNRTDK